MLRISVFHSVLVWLLQVLLLGNIEADVCATDADAVARRLETIFGISARDIRSEKAIINSPTFTAGLAAFQETSHGARRLYLTGTSIVVDQD